MGIRLLISNLMVGLLFFISLSGFASMLEVATSEGEGSAPSSALVMDSTVNTFNTTAPVHVFTPNASTAVIEAEEVQVTAIIYTQENLLERIRPIAVFSGAFLVAVFLIILRRKRRARIG